MAKKLFNILLSLILTVISFGTFTDYSVKAEIDRNSFIRDGEEIDCSSSPVWIIDGDPKGPKKICLNDKYTLYYERPSTEVNYYVFDIWPEDEDSYEIVISSASDGVPAGIKVTGGSGTEEDPFTFGVVFNVSGITLPETLQVGTGETKPLTPILEPEVTFPDVEWTSNNPSVATVDGNGNITGISKGVTTITAVATNGTADDTSDDKTAICEVSVADIFGITLVPEQTSVTVGESVAVTAVTDPAGRAIVWSAFKGESDGEVELYSDAGCTQLIPADSSYTGTVYVKGVNPGTATVTVSGKNDSSVSTSMTVIVYSTEVVPVQSVTVAPESLVMNANSVSERLTATVFPAHATYPGIVWSSSNPAVATVSEDGTVTPVAEGETVITATATNRTETEEDDKRATCNVTVNPPAYTITAAVSPENSGTVTTEPAEKAMANVTVNLTATPAEGYQFVSWDVKNEKGEPVAVSGNAFTMPALGVTVTAVFKEIETYDIWVQGIPVTSVNKDNVLGDIGDPTVVFDPEENTLTLNDANISGSEIGIRAKRRLTIIKGSGTIKGTDEGIRIEGSVYNELIFKDATIDVTGSNSDGIIAQLINIDGGTITAKTENSNACAIAGRTGLTYDDGFMEVIKPVNGDVSFHNGYYRVLDADGNPATKAVIGPKTSFDVTVRRISNGSVTADPAKAEPETSVTLTVSPDEGYKLTSLTVTDDDENEVPTIPVEGQPAKYTFTMPASDVDVSASFEEIVKNYDLWVNGIRVNSENASDILSNKTAQFDAETNTLTLNGANITDAGEKKAGIYSALDSLIITGSNTSTINITVDDKKAVHTTGNLTLNANITANGGEYGIYSGKILTIAGGTITAGGETGIYGYNKIEINGGTVSSTGTDGNGINTPNDLVINGGNVTAHGSDKGIYAGENITIAGGTITASGNNAAIQGTVKYSIAGTGWTDVEGSGTGETIEASPEGQTLSYKKVMFPADSPVTEYTVTVSPAENGSITVDQTSAASGTVITLTVTPDSGYELDSLTVTPAEGDSINPDKKSDTTYTFAMPDSDVTVTAVFKKLPEPGKIDVSGITVTPLTLSLDWGQTSNLTAAVEPENASDKTVNWTSSNPVIATVNNRGVVTAMADGTVTITVTATNGTTDTSDDKTATCEVTVTNLLNYAASWTDPSTGMTYYTQDMASALGSWRSNGGTLTLLRNINYEGITINNFVDNKILDLNGHQLTLSNGLNIIGGTLTLKDSQNTGVVTSPSENGTVNVTGGSFIMQGGTITSTYAADGNNAGTGVSISDGSFTMTGGTITGCGKSGVNVTGGTFNVSGHPVITGNGTLDNPDALAGNVCLGKDKTINVTGKLDDDVQIGVVTEQKPADTESTVSIITGLDGNGSITNFISEDDYEIRWDSEKKEAVIAVPWTYTAKDNVITATRGSKTATLKLEAEDKTYDEKPISAVLTASDGWDTNTGLPDPSKLAITYSPENNGDAGEYTVSITLSNTTAAIKVTINKAAQAAPETIDFTTASASSKTASDGSISGVTEAMEYSTDNGETYTEVSGNKITGLKAGNVLIRYAEDKNHSASEAVTLTVNLADKTYAPVVPGITWTKGSSSGAVFQFKGSRDDDETYELFKEVQADGKTVAAANYTAKPGSVVIELKPAYLETLAEGTHTVKAVMEDGSAEATLIVKKPSSGGGSSPKKPSTPTDNVVTCQMAGYPSNYSWNEAAKACQPGYTDANGIFHPYRSSNKTVPNTYDRDLTGYIWMLLLSITIGLSCVVILYTNKEA